MDINYYWITSDSRLTLDTKAYIESGILESYALGMVGETQREEVERYLAQSEDIRKALDEINVLVEKYTALYAVMPPAALKAKIMDQIRSKDHKPDLPNSIHTRTSSFPYAWAAGTAMLLLAGATIYFYLDARQSKAQLAGKAAEMAQLQATCDSASNAQSQMNEMIAIIRQPGDRPVLMKGTPLSPQSAAIVHWNVISHKAYLDIASLPPAPPDKQYQLWAIVDGKPVDMGVFEVIANQLGMKEMPFIEKPQAFAVTLERKGGSPLPTMEQMYVIGNV